MAFSSRNEGVVGEGRDTGTRDSRVCGILISDIPETSYHRTGEAAAAPAARSLSQTREVCIGGQLLLAQIYQCVTELLLLQPSTFSPGYR